MRSPAPDDASVRFGPYQLHPIQGLSRGSAEVRVTPKALAVLQALVGQAGRVVTKDELFRTVWPDAAVSDATLSSCILELRKALGDLARKGLLRRVQGKLAFGTLQDSTGRVQPMSARKLGVKLVPSAINEDGLPSLYSDPAFWGMTVTQFLGAFNDNVFKQLVLLLAVVGGVAANGKGEDTNGEGLARWRTVEPGRYEVRAYRPPGTSSGSGTWERALAGLGDEGAVIVEEIERFVQGEDHRSAFAHVAPNIVWQDFEDEHERRYGGFRPEDLYADDAAVTTALRRGPNQQSPRARQVAM